MYIYINFYLGFKIDVKYYTDFPGFTSLNLVLVVFHYNKFTRYHSSYPKPDELKTNMEICS